MVDRPLRILLVSHRSDQTGAPKCLLVLAKRLNRYCFLPEVVVPEPGPLLSSLPDDVITHILPRHGFAHMGFRSIRSLTIEQLIRFVSVQMSYFICLYQLLLRRSVDVVHINTSEEIFAAFAAWLARKPIVWHIHETFPVTSGSRILARLIMRLSRVIVLVSNDTRQSFLALAGGGAVSKCQVVYNGIDPASFTAKFDRESMLLELAVPTSTIVITLVGSISQRKGQMILLQSIETLLSCLSAQKIFLFLVGEVGEFDYSNQVLSKISSPKLEPVVRFLGSRQDVPDILNASDIVVVPSLADPFPWVVLEAMALGKPVVASRVGGIAEMVKNGITGILVLPNRPDLLTEALLTLIRDAEMRHQMGNQGRARVVELFTEDSYVHRFEQIYGECFATRRK